MPKVDEPADLAVRNDRSHAASVFEAATRLLRARGWGLWLSSTDQVDFQLVSGWPDGSDAMNAEQREDLQVPPWYLQVARGRYTAARAAQLSGIPERTVYDWAKNGVLKPDLDATKPKAWSYRDLVFLRLLAWLRSKKMPRSEAGQRVSDLRRRLSSGEEVAVLRSDGLGLFLDDAESDAATGRAGLPGLTSFLDEFHLLAPIEAPELGRRELWGPNLLRPSEHTTISPMVMGGDPCVRDTRIPTSSILALHVERALPEEAIVLLYPELGVEQISDAITLEQKLRRAA